MRKKYFCLLCMLSGLWGGAFAAQQNEHPILESTQLATTYSEQGIVKWQMKAPIALQYENEDRKFPEGMFITFFEGDDKQIVWTASANSVDFCAEKNVYELKGDVELKSIREKRQLNTEELYWNVAKEEVYTDKFIRLESEKGMLTGQGLTAQQDLSQYHTSKPQGLINVQSPQ